MNKIVNKGTNKFINLSVILLVIALLIRIAGDLLFTLFDYQLNIGDIWTLGLTLFIAVLLFSIFINNNFAVDNLFNKKTVNINDITKIHNQNYFKELNILLISVIILIILNSFIPKDLNYVNIGESVVYKVLSYTIAFVNLVYVVFAMATIFKWFYSHKHKFTLVYLFIISGIIFLFILIEFEIALFNIVNEFIADTINGLLMFFLFVFVFFVNTKNDWITLLPKKDKLKLLFLSFFALLVFGYLFDRNTDSIYEDSLSLAINRFTPGVIGLYYGSYLIAFSYFFKIFFITLFSLPTSNVVDKKSREFNNLKHLNRLIAGEFNLSKLFRTVLELSINQTRSSYAWMELYNGEECDIAQSINLKHEYISELNVYEGKCIFKTIDRPYLCENTNNDVFFKNIGMINQIAGSLISLPIFDAKKRVGSLVLLHRDKFGLDFYNLESMTAFANNVSIAFENSRLMKQSIEHERYKSEMVLARDLQKKLLPSNLPKIKNYSIAAFSFPAQEAGGDYYDVVRLKNGKMAILVGDVSGKGIAAAFIMAQLKGVVHSMAGRSSTGKELLVNINNSIFNNLSKNEFITMSCLILNDENGHINFARAGHTPLIVNEGGSMLYYKPKGIGLGIINNSMFVKNLEEIEIRLENHSVCYLFTDGINELRNSEMEELGFEGMNEMIRLNGHSSAEEINRDIKESLYSYAKDIEQTDDMTLFTLFYQN